MSEPIKHYVEVEKPFLLAENETPYPAPGEMWIMRDEKGVVQAVNFICPCGCGSECFTPILVGGETEELKRHHWTYAPGPTLTPSIRYTGGCKAHFNITDGNTVMHGDSGK